MMLDPTDEYISIWQLYLLNVEESDLPHLFAVLGVDPDCARHAIDQAQHFSMDRGQLRALTGKPNLNSPEFVWVFIRINPPPHHHKK